MARYRWREGHKSGTWCTTRREALLLALYSQRATRDGSGPISLKVGVELEDDRLDRFWV